MYWQVLNHVWFIFEILNKWIWEDTVVIKKFSMNNKISFLYVTPTRTCLLSFSFNARNFWSWIHQSNYHSLDHHAMNGERTLRISTVPEAWNHPIIGMLFLAFFSYVLNESTLWYLLFMEEILVISMMMYILSLPYS